MQQNYINYVHPAFSLNNQKLDVLGLLKKGEALAASTADFEHKLGALILEWFDEKDYVELTTSGTTGTPKTIRISKKAMVASALATGKYFNVLEGTTALHCLPVQYIAGKMMFIRALILGWQLTYIAPSSNPLQGLTAHFDFVAMVPLQVQNAMDNLHQVKKIIIGGAKLNSELKQQLLPVSSKVYETYGMTETVTHIAAKLITEPHFTALPQVFFKTDSRGCLVIHAPQVGANNVITNDVVDLISETQFNWLGRADNVINSGGVKLFPEKIEEKLEPYIKQRFFVAGIPDEKLGFKLVLVVEGPKVALDFSKIAHVSKYEIPKEIFYVAQFIETETAKIKRTEILKNLIR